MNRKELLRDIMALDQAIDEFMGDLRTRASWDRSNIDADGMVALPCGVGVLHRLGSAREQLGKHVPLLATPAPPVDETDKLETHIWQRADEWVLEISGSINGTHFISRHTEPLTTPKENVAGLPSLYAALADRTQEVQP